MPKSKLIYVCFLRGEISLLLSHGILTRRNRQLRWTVRAMLSERNKTKKPDIVWFHSSELSRRSKSVETERRSVVTSSWVRARMREWLLKGILYLGWWECSKIRLWWWLYNLVDIIETTELYTLKNGEFYGKQIISWCFLKMEHHFPYLLSLAIFQANIHQKEKLLRELLREGWRCK